ncbi:MAG: DUF3857 domain-containing protein [Bacteroidales bacterium]|jgi:hypothetical protein
MKHKNLVLSIMLVLITFTLYSNPEENRKDAEFEQIKIKYTLNKDGSIDYNYHKELKVISNRSFLNVFGETFIVYNPDFQSLKINESYTILPNGEKLQNPANHLNEVLPSNCQDCKKYNHFKEMVVSHTGLENNATIVLDYTLTSKPNFIKELMDVITIAEYAPVKEYDITVEIPNDKELFTTMLGLRLGPSISEEDGKKVYHWNIKNVNQTINDYYLPHNSVLYPTLTFSTIKDMQHAYDAFMSQDAFNNTSLKDAIPTIKDYVSKNEKDEMSNLQSALKVRDFVANNIGLNNIDIKLLNYKLNTALETWEANCGNKAEKAILLSALLNELGFKSNVVGLVFDPLHKDYIGNLETIEDWGVQTLIDNQSYIFSVVGNLKYSLENDYNGYTIYNFDPLVKNFRANYIGFNENNINFSCKIDMNAKGSAKFIEIFTNSHKIPTFDIDKDQKNAAKMIKNATVEINQSKFDITKFSGSFNIVGDNSNKMSDGYFYIKLPETNLGLTILPSLLTTVRETPIYCEKTSESYKYEIKLPTFAEYVGNSKEININEDFGSLNISIKEKDGVVFINRNLNINNEIIFPHQYKKFREMMMIWNDNDYKKVIYKNKQ